MQTVPIDITALSSGSDSENETTRWGLRATLPSASPKAGFQIGLESANGPRVITWENATQSTARLLRWGGGLYLEIDGEIRNFTWLDRNTRVETVAFRWTPSTEELASPHIQPDSLPPSTPVATLSRRLPFERRIFTVPLNWMNRTNYRAVSATEYDLPIAPIDTDLTWDLQKMYENGVTVVTLDNLATKRPAEVIPFYTQFRRWKQAVDDFEKQGRGRMFYTPFWEFDAVGARSTSTSEQDDSAAYIADILGFFDANNATDPAFLKLQDRPFHFVYNSMYYARPPFWEKVVDRLHQSGRTPVLSLGVGGIPMTVRGEFSAPEMAAYTDELFESVFVFQLWSSKADGLPRDITAHLSGHKDARHFVGPASPGYWSVRREMQSYVDFRFTQRLRETLNASLLANADALHLTTWDDWQETNNFAPSFNNLTSRLEIVQALTAHWRGSDSEISTDTPRVIVSYKKTWRAGEPIGFEVLALPSSSFTAPLVVTLDLLDENHASIARLVTPPLDPRQNQDHLFTLPTEALTSFAMAAPGLITVKVAVRDTATGRDYPAGNLPQIPILPDSFFDTDLTYYSIPLHRLAPMGRTPSLLINGVTGIAQANGAITYNVELPSPASGSFRWAATRNGHPLRFMAPNDKAGAEVTLRLAGGPWKLSARDPAQPFHDSLPPALPYPTGKPATEADMKPYPGKGAGPLISGGTNHYTALVEYPDGKYAYTPTVWTLPSDPASTLSGLWVMAPDRYNVVSDQSAARQNLLIEPTESRRFTTHPISGAPVLALTGDKGIPLPLNIIPGGPATVECVFSYRPTGRPMSLFSQSGGAQLELSIDATGTLVLTRSDFDKNSVSITSPRPLAPDLLTSVAAVYTGSEIRLYVGGELVSKTSVTGSRTNEGVLLGGSPQAPFSGTIHKVAIHGGALDEDTLRRNAY